ncbi:LOW QUALITY PROTEIN: hypothetical protein BC936DRAFT_142563 [Jimgerdemannia flammicorona]|uniref:Exosome complex component N-terminal domain-containing protein n=1 Tax=Jimgerdemannia flammicorona TaxID=994334 RepID=A0A433DEY9_9FUNG|nr:LOW QUALITY PROTEIN: hypothetical protein BC936DRAFT_142563 [Jimgerdemannia flammicorona]
MAAAETVTPGQRLGHLQDYLPGPGTYARQGLLYASVVGVKQILETKGAKLPTMIVSRQKEQSVIPDVESIIIGKVVRVNPRFANVAIMVVGTTPCREDFQGIVRLTTGSVHVIVASNISPHYPSYTVFKISAQPRKTRSRSTTPSAPAISFALKSSRSVMPDLTTCRQRGTNWAFFLRQALQVRDHDPKLVAGDAMSQNEDY